MPEDEFFKRIAETLVVEEPVDKRPLGTASRRSVSPTEPASEEAPSDEEPVAGTARGERADGARPLEKREHRAGDDRVQRWAHARWPGARLAAASVLSIAAVAVALAAILALTGPEEPLSSREMPRALVGSPPPTTQPATRPRRAPSARAKSGQPGDGQGAKPLREPQSDRQAGDPTSAAAQTSIGSTATQEGGGAREAFGFEDGG
jgi:hypothetical protein